MKRIEISKLSGRELCAAVLNVMTKDKDLANCTLGQDDFGQEDLTGAIKGIAISCTTRRLGAGFETELHVPPSEYLGIKEGTYRAIGDTEQESILRALLCCAYEEPGMGLEDTLEFLRRSLEPETIIKTEVKVKLEGTYNAKELEKVLADLKAEQAKY